MHTCKVMRLEHINMHYFLLLFHFGPVVIPTSRVVVSCHLSRSHALLTCESRASDETNLVLVTLGLIDVDIPQHPVALHSMMTRSSRTISSHISEIQTQRSAIRYEI